jgi:hypothetical protein
MQAEVFSREPGWHQVRDNKARSEIIFSVEQDPEGGYIAEALGHDIVTQGESLDELRRMVRDAVRCHFEPGSKPSVIHLSLSSGPLSP